jgi:signal transduction histidine kinase
MELCASNEEVAGLERALLAATESTRLSVLYNLAWQLRQRDCNRAWELADQAQVLLLNGHLSVLQQQRITRRLLLVRCEVKWLMGELSQACDYALAALDSRPQEADDEEDALIQADVHWLQAWLAFNQGDMTRLDEELKLMAMHAQEYDPVRTAVAHAALGAGAAFRDVVTAKQQWEHYFTNVIADPVALCWVEHFKAVLASLSGDFRSAIGHWSQSHDHANQTGQVRWAIITAANIGDVFNHLNDYNTALQWLQRALLLARHTGWPAVTAWALVQSAETRRCLEEHDAAFDLLQEALALLTPMAASRVYAIALQCFGKVELARQQYASAKTIFELMEQRAAALGQTDLQYVAHNGQAQALLELGQAHQALEIAHMALASGHGNADDQMATLRILAQIHARHGLPAPPGVTVASAALHYLLQAMNLAGSIESYTIPGDLLELLAQEYANVGDHVSAFEYARQAIAARHKTYTREVANRALALQIQQTIEKAHYEVEQHKHMAAAESRRAEVLQKTSTTLAYLGYIGQEITACLETRRVFEILDQYLHHLLDVGSFAIYTMSDDGQALELAFGVEDGNAIPFFRILLSESDSNSVRCVRERREIVVEYDPAQKRPAPMVGSRFNLSRMYGPLQVAERVLGLITVQTLTSRAYGEREQLIFRALGAWTAIAMANAEAHSKLAHAHSSLALAHRQLQDTQQQLILQGKMAGLGTLTAGVAHEINNPTNFVHVAAQIQRMDLAEFERFVESLLEADTAPEILQGFARHFEKLTGNVDTMLTGTERIIGIVKDLRSFTRLDEAEKKVVCLSECLLSTLNLVRSSWDERVDFIIEFLDDPELECWPALLNQVFMNLLMNACQAIEEKRRRQQASARGWLCLRLLQRDRMLVVEMEDDGGGIELKNQARIMEPFFTTKEVGQGTGLGLSIAFGIIEKHGGNLHFRSTPGVGSCFIIELPLIDQGNVANQANQANQAS